MKKIIFFTAGSVPTSAEITALQEIENETSFAVFVRNAKDAAKMQYGSDREECDLTAGTVPTIYSDVPAYTPGGELPDGTAAVADAATVVVQNSAGAAPHNATASVTGNTLTAVKLAATSAMIDNAAAVTIQNSAAAAVPGTHPATVANGVLSVVKLAATIAPVASGAQNITDVAGKASSATRTVASGAITTTILAATDCIVKNGNTFTAADGGTITVAVAAGVPTFTYTAP